MTVSFLLYIRMDESLFPATSLPDVRVSKILSSAVRADMP